MQWQVYGQVWCDQGNRFALAVLAIGGAQHLMAADHSLQAGTQQLDRQFAAQAQRHGHAIGGTPWGQLLDHPQPALHQRQRRLGADGAGLQQRQRWPRLFVMAQAGDKRVQPRVIEQGTQLQARRQLLAHPRHHLGRQQ